MFTNGYVQKGARQHEMPIPEWRLKEYLREYHDIGGQNGYGYVSCLIEVFKLFRTRHEMNGEKVSYLVNSCHTCHHY